MVVSLGGIGSGPMAPTRSSSNSNSSSTTNHGSDAASGLTWLAIYFCLNLTLTIYNKAIMSMVGFRFPWMLTALHTFCGTVGCYVAAYGTKSFQPTVLTSRENWIMIAFSMLYTINIAVSNLSLNMVTVPMHQIIRATTPIFTILLSILFLQKQYSKEIYISLVPLIFGVAFATYGEYSATFFGFVLTILGAFLAAVKTIVTHRVQVGSLKLHPLDLLLRMSPLAFLQCMFFGYLSGEWHAIRSWNALATNRSISYLWLNGFLAFFLNVVSFTANKKTSALTMTVAGNVKQVLSIILAVFIFHLSINTVNAFGILCTLGGGAWYTYLEYQEKKRARQHRPPPVTSSSSASLMST